MLRDLLLAMRSLSRNPLFAVAVAAILALGIGANTAVFSIVDAVLLRPLPYAAADRLVSVEESSNARAVGGIPAQEFRRWRDRTDIFEMTVSYIRDTVTITGAGDPEQVIAVRASGLFHLLGARAQLGRTLAAADDQSGSANAVVLSDRLWRRCFHADPGVIGRGLTIADEACTIVGVLPADFEFRYSGAELWVPLRLTPATGFWVQVAARLKRGVSAPQAQSAMAIVARQLEQESPADRAGLKIAVTPWSDTPDRKYELTLVFVLAAVSLVLLIACADAGSLLLSRAVRRQKEIAIRASLGSGFWRVARQLLAESFVLAAAGSVAGLALARWLLHLLANRLAALPIVLPHLQRVGLNARVLAFSALVCLLLSILCSLAPLWLAACADLQAVLRGGSVGSAARGSRRLFSALIAAEAAFAFLLLVGSGLMIRSLVRLQQEDHGLHADHVLTLRVPVGTLTQPRPTGRYDTRPRQMAYYREILEHVKTVPGIRNAAIVNNLPLSGVNSVINLKGPDGATSTRTVSPEYFAVMGIPLIAGRTFADSDVTGAPRVAIINQYLARKLFPDSNPLGQLLPEADSAGPGPAVVGIVKDTPQMSYELPAKGEIYIPYQQFFFAAFMATVVVRTEGDPTGLAAALQKQVWAVDPKQPIVKVETMDDLIAEAIWRPRFSAWIFTVLGGLALLLTSAGVYSVIAYTTTLRAREVGIRVAMGATPRQVLLHVLRGAMRPLAIGLAVSVAGALLLARLLESLLYEVSSSDPVTYAAAAVLLLAIGAAATLRPAWRAATGDPMEALRSE